MKRNVINNAKLLPNVTPRRENQHCQKYRDYVDSMVFSVHPIFGNHSPNQGIMVQIWETWSLFGPSFWLSPKPKPK